ncbi:flagellar biosynthesis repressor FlbT [Paracoccus thiocyanatus]|uniref:flagellar biosynthesis repressor FlbT n=1 Tax=Paracoccus thiocyanatus TaxID=34006 RepID=UPI00122D0B1A|nr:flagellar biosynthesis repressor FlbT [Paracoccus thiocyanatus]
MTGLVLKLAPKERVLVNGVVIENGDRRSRISIITPNAHVLRLKDAIHPDSANTPVSRLCYICQLLLIGDADIAEGRRQVILGIEQLSQILPDTDSQGLLGLASNAVIEGDFYRAFKKLRALLPREARLIAIGKP